MPARRRHVGDPRTSGPTDVAGQPAPRGARGIERDGDTRDDRRGDDARRASAARLPFLHAAIESIASPTIRNLATVGGNLFARQPHGDLAVCLLALDAQCDIDQAAHATSACSRHGARHRDHASTSPSTGSTRKAMRREQNSASIVTVASDGTRIALGGVAPRPVRALAAEAALAAGRHRQGARELSVEAADPFDDAYASAWYRRRVLPVHVRRASDQCRLASSNSKSTASRAGVRRPARHHAAQRAARHARPDRRQARLRRRARAAPAPCLLDGDAVMSCLVPVETDQRLRA